MTTNSEVQYPSSIYKYRDWSIENHRRMLTEGEIFFASSSTFNDPFDCRIDPVFVKSKKAGVGQREINRIVSTISVLHPEWPEQRILTEAYRLRHRKQSFGLTAQRKWLEDFSRRRSEMFGLFSVSEVRDCNLMWSHYANAHTGFCVGFSFVGLLDDFGKLHSVGKIAFPQQVGYVETYPVWNYMDLGEGDAPIVEFISKSISTKSSDWSYEREWRLVLSSKAPAVLSDVDRTFSVKPSVLTEVILGARMTSEVRNEILEVVSRRYPDVSVLDAEIKNSFLLDLRDVARGR